MDSMDDCYKAIISLILDVVGQDYPQYTNSDGNLITPIFRGYDNSIVLPKNNNYIVVTSLYDENMSLGWQPVYNKNTHINKYGTLMSTRFNIDIYGNNAEKNARIIYMLMQDGYANLYWKIHDNPYSIYKVKKANNLSDIFGRDMYNKRFLLEVDIFNQIEKELPVDYFNNVDFKLNLVQREN